MNHSFLIHWKNDFTSSCDLFSSESLYNSSWTSLNVVLHSLSWTLNAPQRLYLEVNPRTGRCIWEEPSRGYSGTRSCDYTPADKKQWWLKTRVVEVELKFNATGLDRVWKAFVVFYLIVSSFYSVSSPIIRRLLHSLRLAAFLQF